MLNTDDFTKLAQDVFDDDIDVDETPEEKIVRLERENIILFKRNIELTDQLQYMKTYDTYYDNRDRLMKRFGSDFVRKTFDQDDDYLDDEIRDDVEMDECPTSLF
jgi:hypothetical protein